MAEPIDIETIVREVLRRLTAASERATVAAAPLVATASDTLVVSERLITLAALDGKLNGAKQLAVPPKAIVTPAVKDELKRRGIAIVRQDAPAPAATNVTLLAAQHGDLRSGSSLRTAVSQAASGVEWLESHATQSLAGIVRELATHVVRRQASGILLTNQPLAAVVLANRNPAIRAAAVIDVPALDEAITTVGANLVAVHPERVSPFVLKTIVQRLAAATPVCPAELSARGAN